MDQPIFDGVHKIHGEYTNYDIGVTFIGYRWSSQRDWFSCLCRYFTYDDSVLFMSISLATPRASLVSSDNFPSQASSMIWKIITKKKFKGKMNEIAIVCFTLDKIDQIL